MDGKPVGLMDTNERLALMRDILYQEPSMGRWKALCALLDGWSQGPGLDAAVEYAGEHLERWPDGLRAVPDTWMPEVWGQRPPVRLKLARCLNLSGRRISPSQAASLGSSASIDDNISVMILQENALGDEGAAALARGNALGKLTRLVVASNQLRGKGAGQLALAANMPSLEVLDLGWNFLRQEFWDVLAQARGPVSWRRLAVPACGLGAALLGVLVKVPALRALRALDLSSNYFKDEGLECLLGTKGFARLARLDIANNRFGPDHLGALGGSKLIEQLKWLDLSNNALGASGLGALVKGEPTGLQGLLLAETQTEDAGVAALATSNTMASLRRLDLGHNQLGASAMLALANSPRAGNLRHLMLDHNALGNAGVKALTAGRGVQRLETLSLASNGLTGGAMDALGRWSGLGNVRRLSLWSNKLDDDALERLLRSDHLAGLHALDLAHNQIGPKGAGRLASDPAMASLQSLVLTNNPIEEAGLEALLRSPYLATKIKADLRRHAPGILGRPSDDEPHHKTLGE